MPSHRPDIRFDFKYTPVEFDEKNRLVTFVSEPDPERYEYQEKDGKKGYYDKFDKIFIPKALFEQIHLNLKGNQIFYSPSKIDDANKYLNDRIEATFNFFEDEVNDINFEKTAISKDFLVDLDNVKMNFVILSIDLKGSTKMSQELPIELNAKIISFFLSEMTLLIDKFNGYILKYTGDGLLAYFPEPNDIGKVDNALNCAYLMRSVVDHVINPLLAEHSYPLLYFRIGLDYGKAIVKKIGSTGIKSFGDIFGDTVNIAVKIQELASDNQILVGASVAHMAHTYWRKRLTKFKLPKNWKFKDKVRKRPYLVYTLKDDF
jgi:adenylate cyclase